MGDGSTDVRGHFPVSGLRSPVSGLRSESLDAWEGWFESPEWIEARRIVRAVLRRCCPRWLVDDAAAEAEVRLIERACREEPVACWPAYAARVAECVARRARRSVMVELVLDVAAPPARLSFDELVLGRRVAAGALRGSMQQLLVTAVAEGRTCTDIADALGVPAREVRRQVSRLAVLLGRRQESRRNPLPTSTP